MRQTEIELYVGSGPGRFNFRHRDFVKLSPAARRLMVDKPINYSLENWTLGLDWCLDAYWGQKPTVWPWISTAGSAAFSPSNNILWWKVKDAHLLPPAHYWPGYLRCVPDELEPKTIILFAKAILDADV